MEKQNENLQQVTNGGDQTTTPEVTYEYGAMSSKYSVKATNKLVAYAVMVMHYGRSAHMIAIYSPESSKADSWLNITGKIAERLDEIFGDFDEFVKEHIDEIRIAYKTIEQLV